MARWVGFCAPGYRPAAWLQVLADPELSNVTEIYEEPSMAGETDVVLVDLDAIPAEARAAAESAITRGGLDTSTWPDGTPVTPWADPWHDVAGDLRAIRNHYFDTYGRENPIAPYTMPPPVVTLECGHSQPDMLPILPGNKRVCRQCAASFRIVNPGDDA